MIYVKEEDTRTNDERELKRRRKDIFIITNRFRTKHDEHQIKRKRDLLNVDIHVREEEEEEKQLPVQQQQSIRQKKKKHGIFHFDLLGFCFPRS